jgi:hypothetical protein
MNISKKMGRIRVGKVGDYGRMRKEKKKNENVVWWV